MISFEFLALNIGIFDSKYNLSLLLTNELFIYMLLKVILPYFNISDLYWDISTLINFPSEFNSPSLLELFIFSDDSIYVFDIESFNLELSKFPLDFME